MDPYETEALQMAVLQELNDVEGVRGVASKRNEKGALTLVIHVTGEDCADTVKERLKQYGELPPCELIWT